MDLLKEITTGLDEILPILNSAKDYNEECFHRLLAVNRKIKQYILKNTPIDPQIRKFYRKFTPGMYVTTVYSNTHNAQKAIDAYKIVEFWGAYIVFDDLYYEHHSQYYKNIANYYKDQTLTLLTTATKKSLKPAEQLLQQYWDLEIEYIKLLKSDHKFSDEEIRKFMSLKGTSIISELVILGQSSDIPKNLMDFINYNSAVFDFFDDYWDLKEDTDNLAPNCFVMTLKEFENLDKLVKLSRKK